LFHKAIFAASSVTSSVKSAPLTITTACDNVDAHANHAAQPLTITHHTNPATLQ
jgi:hypothetical protein